jgi:hypothetical protein
VVSPQHNANSIKEWRLWQALRNGKKIYKQPSASAAVIFDQG